MEGASNGSALRSRTWPREDGRNWQTEYVQPENGCTLPPARSADRVAKWNWVSGVRLAGFTRQNRPPWLIPTASGPTAKQQPLQSHAGAATQRAQLVVGGDGPAWFRR